MILLGGAKPARKKNTMKKLVIIPCGGAKQTQPAPAAELYVGSMFADTLRTARTMTTDDNIRILSAKHGLISLDQIVEPYDLKIGQAGSVTSATLNDQLNAFVPTSETFVIDALLPKAYINALEEASSYWIENHFAGCAGIGYQKAALKNIREGANA